MRVISKRRLRDFWTKYPDSRAPLLAWWKTAIHADWTNLQDVRKTYWHADGVRLDCGVQVAVFNIGGNQHRLVLRMICDYRRVYVKAILTHREYDTGNWKVQICREER